MNKYICHKQENMVLINFNFIFKQIEVDFINDLTEYNLIKDYKINFSKKDIKKLFYHHVIFGICEEIKNSPKHKKVLIIPPELKECEIFNYCDYDDFNKILLKLLQMLEKCLPFLIHFTSNDIFIAEITDSGESIEFINILSAMIDKKESKTFTFERLKSFSKKWELTFLSKTYFNDVKTKLLLH